MNATKKKLGELVFDLPDGKHIEVPVYLSSGPRACHIENCYGRIVGLIGKSVMKEKWAWEALRCQVETFSDLNKMAFEPILDWNSDPKTVYFLGKKRILTNDPMKKDDSNYFYVEKNAKFVNAYDNRRMEYAKERLLEEIKKTDIDFDSFKNRFSLKIGFDRRRLGYVKQREFGKFEQEEFFFDRGLFAYSQPVIDSVVDHELAHQKDGTHSKEFFDALYLICPKARYDSCREALYEGRFNYVPTEND